MLLIFTRIMQIMGHLMDCIRNQYMRKLQLDHKRILLYSIKWANWKNIKVNFFSQKRNLCLKNVNRVFLDTSDQPSVDQILKEEEKILQNLVETRGKWIKNLMLIINVFCLALMGVAELAKGIEYTDPIKTRYE